MERILRQTAYNAWANTQLFNVLKTIGVELFLRPNGSSFPSICETALHIWDAEFIWLNRLQGKAFKTLPSKDWKKEDDLGGWINCSNALRDYCSEQELAWWQRTARYPLLSGVEQTMPHADMVMHATNHSTFHRGQIVTMLRQGGMTHLPNTDLIHYVSAFA